MFRQWFCWLLLVMVCLWTNGPVSAQERVRLVHPVKQNHLWGFTVMSKRGNTEIVPPRYDAIGEKVKFLVSSSADEASQSTGYRMVELNGKLGIINDNLDEVLPCNNDFVQPVSLSQFLVKQEAGYTILDSAGRNLLGQHFPQLEFAGLTDDGTHYYTIFEQGKKGIINAQGDTLLPCLYAEIKPLQWRTAPFLTRRQTSERTWDLVERGGKVLLRELADVQAPHPAVLLVTEGHTFPLLYEAYDPLGKPLAALKGLTFKGGVYLSPELVNLEQFLPSENKDIQTLYQVKERETILPQFLDYRSLDRQYGTAAANRTDPYDRRTFLQETLISPQGEIVDTNNWYLHLAAWPGHSTYYRARGRYGWGIINRRGQEIVSTEYQEIGALEDGLALVRRKDSVGVINADGDLIVPTSYTKISRQDKKLLAQKGNRMTILEIDDRRQVENVSEYQNFSTITITQPDSYRIANRLNFANINDLSGAKDEDTCNPSAADLPASGTVTEPDRTRFDCWFIRDSIETNKIIPDTSTLAAEALGIDSVFMVSHSPPILLPGFFTRFYAKKSIRPDQYMQRLVTGEEICVRPQRLLADGIGKLVQDSVLGFRVFDFVNNWNYAPALNKNGRFFLLGRDAEPLRDDTDSIMEFTFVGEAKHGLLRVCVGGRLAKPHPDSIPSEPLASLNGSLTPFQLALSCGTLEKSHSSLIVRSLPGDTARWGVLDQLGNWVVPPVYDYIDENIAGQMIARQGLYYGVIDGFTDTVTTVVPFNYRKIRSYKGFWRVNSQKIGEVYFNWRGHQIADVDCDSVSIFREGYAAKLVDGRWSYIDELGEPLGDKDFLQARPFGEGLAAVQLDSTQWAFVDTTGQLHAELSALAYQDLSFFASGRCRFRRGAKFGYLNREFEEIPFPALFRRASNFDRGRAIVTIGSGVAVIDTAGSFVVEPLQYKMLTPWNEAGLAVATRMDGKKQLVDLDGQTLHDTPFDDIRLQGGPLYPIRQGELWGYIDQAGNQVIRCLYSRAEPFVDGHARIQKRRGGERWHFIDTTGTTINQEPYGSAQDFSNGLALVRNYDEPYRLLQHDGNERRMSTCDKILFVDGRFIGCSDGEETAFFVDHNGGEAFLHTYEEIKPFGTGEMTFVKAGGRWGIIDRRGMQLVACKYYFVDDSRPDGIFKVGPPAFGIYDRCGKLVVPVKFDNLELMEKNLFRVERGEKVGYLSTKGEEIWPLDN